MEYASLMKAPRLVLARSAAASLAVAVVSALAVGRGHAQEAPVPTAPPAKISEPAEAPQPAEPSQPVEPEQPEGPAASTSEDAPEAADTVEVTTDADASPAADAGPTQEPLEAQSADPSVSAAPELHELAESESAQVAQASESVQETPIEVTIVGTRLARTPGSAHVVRGKDLERFKYDDPTLVLTAVPGVYSRTEDGMGLRPNIGLRGANPDRSKKVTLMEDGVLFGPAPYSAPAAYYFPVITRMTQVRVIKGPSSVAYGPQTVGGAIDLQTRAIPSQASGALDLAAGQYGYTKAHAHFGASNENFGFLVEGIQLQNSGFKELPNGGDTGAVRNEWMGKFNYVVDPDARVRNEFRLKLTYSDETSNETYLGLTDADFKQNPYQRYGASSLDRMKNHRFAMALTHQVDFTPRMSLTTTAYRNVYSRVWRRVDGFSGSSLSNVLSFPGSQVNAPYAAALSGAGDLEAAGGNAALVLATNARDFVSQGVVSNFRWDGQTGEVAHRLEAGLRLHYDRIERRHSADKFDLFGGELYPNRTATQVTAFNRGETFAVAPHVLYAMTWKRLTVTPGMRTELMRMSFANRDTGAEVTGFGYALLPGLGTYTALTEELGLVLGAYRGFSPTPPENIKNAEPEYSVNYEGGLRYNKGALRAEAIGFYNDYSNLTNYCTASGGGCSAQNLDQQTSAGHARIYGVEAMAGHELSAGPVKVPVYATYTYTEATFLESFDSSDPSWGNVKKGDVIPYVPKHQLRGQVGVEHKRAGGMVALTYVAAMSEGKLGSGADRKEFKTDAQTLVDASAWVRVWGPFQLYGTVQNLLDSTYLVARRPFGARPNAPRWMHVGLKASF